MLTGATVALRPVERSDAEALHVVLNEADLFGHRYVADEFGPVSMAFVEKKLRDGSRTKRSSISRSSRRTL